MTLNRRRCVVMLFLIVALAAGVAVPPADADSIDGRVVAVYGQPS